MRQLYIKTILCVVISMLSLTANAYDFELDGIYYEIHSNVYVVKGDINYKGNINIPDSVIYNGKSYRVVHIDEYAFRNCTDLISVIIPNSVATIGESCFSGCTSLKSLTLSKSISSLRYGTFENCISLTSVIIPDGLREIGRRAFYGCSGLTSLSLSNSVEEIDYAAFYGCTSLTSIIIPNGVKNIVSDAFYGCSSLSSISVTTSVTSVGSNAFYGTKWYEDQPDGIVYLGHIVYSYKGTMPSGTELILKDGIHVIAGNALYGFNNMNSITIPNSVTNIGFQAFAGCNGLKTIFSQIEEPFRIDEYTFSIFDYYNPYYFDDIIYNNAKLYVPLGTKEMYEATPAWNRFANIEEYDYEQSDVEAVEHSPLTIEHYYTPDGVRSDKPQRGLNIIRMSDGTTRKVFVK